MSVTVISQSIIKPTNSPPPEGQYTLTVNLSGTTDATSQGSIGPMMGAEFVYEFNTKNFKTPVQLSTIQSIELSVTATESEDSRFPFFIIYIPDSNKYFFLSFADVNLPAYTLDFGVNVYTTSQTFLLGIIGGIESVQISLSVNNFQINSYTFVGAANGLSD